MNSTTRIQSVDILRGLVLVLMAVDHVRVYAGIPSGSFEVGIFFTRWITHFCAPAFAFFAGTSAFLYGQKVSKQTLAKFLVTRGLILVVLEMTLIRFLWAFHIDYSEFMLAGVIWMLGWCMVLMAALIWLRAEVVGYVGLAIIFLQQVFGYLPYILPTGVQASFAKFWAFIYPSGLDGPESIAILYVIVPWIGVMAAGYGFGLILNMDAARRKRMCMNIGLGAIVLFLAIASIRVVTSSKEDPAPFIFELLNQQKYPASQLFLMMTLGPIIFLVPFVETAKSGVSKMLAVFGRVPFFYYLLHILVIYLSALAVQLISSGVLHQEWYNTAPFTFLEDGDRWSLGTLYLVFAIDVVILYFACRWYDRFKSDHPGNKLLKYV